MAERRFMGSRGTILLIIVGFAFLASIILFYNVLHIGMFEKKAYYAGDSAFDVYRAYEKGEEMLLFLETGVKFAYNKANLDESAEGVSEDEFKKYFEEYLVQFDAVYNQELKIDDFEFEISDVEVSAKTEKRLVVKEGYAEYSPKATFAVEIK